MQASFLVTYSSTNLNVLFSCETFCSNNDLLPVIVHKATPIDREKYYLALRIFLYWIWTPVLCTPFCKVTECSRIFFFFFFLHLSINQCPLLLKVYKSMLNRWLILIIVIFDNDDNHEYIEVIYFAKYSVCQAVWTVSIYTNALYLCHKNINVRTYATLHWSFITVDRKCTKKCSLKNVFYK